MTLFARAAAVLSDNRARNAINLLSKRMRARKEEATHDKTEMHRSWRWCPK